SQPFAGGGPTSNAFANLLLVISFRFESNSILLFKRWAITPRQNTWLNGADTAKFERAFSSPLQALRKLAKWLEGVAGTCGSLLAKSLALSSGMIFKVLACEPALTVSSLLEIIFPGSRVAGSSVRVLGGGLFGSNPDAGYPVGRGGSLSTPSHQLISGMRIFLRLANRNF